MHTLTNVFERANNSFLYDEKQFILSEVAERALCGSLKSFILEELLKTPYQNYFVDIEYNRNQGKIKTIVNDDFEVATVNCDLIVHSRGQVIAQDNLLALEMKKSTRPLHEKTKDKKRLIALTKSSYDDVWSNDGMGWPCRSMYVDTCLAFITK